MSESTRHSVLASRHRALGSELEDWNGMGTAWTYASDPCAEHDAVRGAAGLFDMSPLKKVYLRGPDALKVADHVITRDMTGIYPGKSAYGAILTPQGTVCDDAIIANNGADEWLFCHGSGESMAYLQESAEGLNVSIELDDALHNLSLQGPKALALLNRFCSADLSGMAYFHHQAAELFGHPCRISRTGYSGERGYEILVDQAWAGDIWDNLLSEGAGDGVMPCSFTALDKVRIEAGLLFYGYDMTTEHTPWEVGLGFTVSRNKGSFRGKDALFAAEQSPRILPAGFVFDHSDSLAGGEVLKLDGETVGVVNSPCWSHRMNQSLALGHVSPAAASPGTALVAVAEDGSEYLAKVSTMPFYDPQKRRTHEG
ncbi:aminomethyltransferase family protein [Aliamphritea hakodatensis]|uniref:aminomethyltransferase family protein n=1 Tax=Aliamphritea hakodatensis TaxID=2895352 RepID=UPI0022FD4A24|nr:aminomethyltransferase family protein [Aliamphritea hakodatensis]